MGYWEGIDVPDHEQGYRAIDYADKTLNLFIEKIDIKLRNVENEQPEYWRGYLTAMRELKQLLKE